MSVSLQPGNALGFNRPLTELVKRSLTITNNNPSPVAFKVKTTAPKLYCVRPNSGRVEPGESVEVSVMLQAMKEEPPAGAKCRDKFLIQSTLITPDKESMALSDIWNVTDGEESKVHQQKLKVLYLPAEGETLPEEDENPGMSSMISNTDDSRFETVRQHPRGANGHPEAILEFGEDSQQDHSAVITPPQRPETPIEVAPAHIEEPVYRYEAPAPAPVPQVIIPSVSVTTHTTPPPTHRDLPPPREDTSKTDELLLKLKAAQLEIDRLRELLSNAPEPSEAPTSITGVTELRRRRRALSDDGSTMAGTDVGTYVEGDVMEPEGVPLPIVIVIALGVFVTTYLFF